MAFLFRGGPVKLSFEQLLERHEVLGERFSRRMGESTLTRLMMECFTQDLEEFGPDDQSEAAQEAMMEFHMCFVHQLAPEESDAFQGCMEDGFDEARCMPLLEKAEEAAERRMSTFPSASPQDVAAADKCGQGDGAIDCMAPLVCAEQFAHAQEKYSPERPEGAFPLIDCMADFVMRMQAEAFKDLD